ncbi:MAG: acylphosphatase [Ignavibacteriaceae bacterium]|nr:acylphosphatase [Ignavibacteriaceae bacterium]
MAENIVRAEITVNGLVQGVGFRYYILRHAHNLGLNGYVKNLYTGEVYVLTEGERGMIEELIKLTKTGPSHAHVNNCRVEWSEPTNEFTTFEIRL